jgi:hypothetical protein
MGWADKDWQLELTNMLIDAGTVGVTQNEIMNRFRPMGEPELVMNELEVLREMHKVQRFEIPPEQGEKRRVQIVWRATNLITKISV